MEVQDLLTTWFEASAILAVPLPVFQRHSQEVGVGAGGGGDVAIWIRKRTLRKLAV